MTRAMVSPCAPSRMACCSSVSCMVWSICFLSCYDYPSAGIWERGETAERRGRGAAWRGRCAMAAAHSRAGSGHARRCRARPGQRSRRRAESGHSRRCRAPFGHAGHCRATFRHFLGSERPNLARSPPYCPKCARQCDAVQISPDNPRVVRIVPDNASTVQISPGNAAAQPRHDRRAKPPAPTRRLRTAGGAPAASSFRR